MAQLISTMQKQLVLQRQQLEEQRQQAKEQSRAQEKTLLLEQHQQAEAREEKLIQALTDGATTTKGAHLSVASGSIPKFAPFDASVELWKHCLVQFTTFVGANSIPDEKIAQVFLTNQSTTTYKLLCTVGHCYYYRMLILRALLRHHYCVIMCHMIGFLISYATQQVSEVWNGIKIDPLESTCEEA